MNEQAFLEGYDPKAFDAPLFTVDSVLFTYHEEQLKVLLVERSNHPEKGKWGLPGGFVDLQRDQSLEAAAIRALEDKTGVTPPYIEQLMTKGGPDRDKRGWSVTACYSALIDHQICAAKVDRVSDAQWIDLVSLDELTLAFDHRELIAACRKRLKQKALYSIVPGYALSEKFTLSDLQRLHEVLIGKPIQKKSFRRRIEQANLLEDTGERRSERGRPASLYRMKPGTASHTFVRNLEA